MDRKMTVEDVKKFAWENYNRGGDVIIECWSDEEIQQFLDEGNGESMLKDLFDIWHDRYMDAINSI